MITIFRIKKGINYYPEDPNYYLFRLACKVSSKRLFPNFTNQDAWFNMQYYNPADYRTYISTMGCRTRVVSNVDKDNEVVTGRGNFSFTTINLPMLGIEAKGDVDKFFKRLDEVMELCKEQLLWRLELVGKRHKYNYPFILGQNIFNGADKLDDEDEILPILIQQSLSIGFVGLAETLVALTGKHQGESEDAQELGLRIIRHMREMTDKYSDDLHLNFSLFATPAESTAGSMLRATKKLYGVIPGVTDKDYFTNSFHKHVCGAFTVM